MKMKILGAFIAVFVSFPLYMYILYKILVHIEATELMWFLFYIYVPVNLISVIMYRLYGEEEGKK